MTDAEDTNEPQTTTPVDPKRAAMLERLVRAREAARQRRIEIGDITRREKQIRLELEQKRRAKVEDLERRAEKVLTKKSRQSVKRPLQVESSTESETEEEEEEEEEEEKAPPPPPKPIKRVGAKRHDPVEKLHSSYLTAQIAREQLAQRIATENYNTAFSSLFPGYRFMH